MILLLFREVQVYVGRGIGLVGRGCSSRAGTDGAFWIFCDFLVVLRGLEMSPEKRSKNSPQSHPSSPNSLQAFHTFLCPCRRVYHKRGLMTIVFVFLLRSWWRKWSDAIVRAVH